MKRFYLMCAFLSVFALAGATAIQGHPVEPSDTGTETALSQQVLGQTAITVNVIAINNVAENTPGVFIAPERVTGYCYLALRYTVNKFRIKRMLVAGHTSRIIDSGGAYYFIC